MFCSVGTNFAPCFKLVHTLFLILMKSLILQKSGTHLPIPRSHSVPELIKDGSIRQMDNLGVVFRVIPGTPRVPEGSLATSNATPTVNAGKFILLSFGCFFMQVKCICLFLENSKILFLSCKQTTFFLVDVAKYTLIICLHNQPTSYLSLVVQMEMLIIMVRIFRKKKLYVESALLN